MLSSQQGKPRLPLEQPFLTQPVLGELPVELTLRKYRRVDPGIWVLSWFAGWGSWGWAEGFFSLWSFAVDLDGQLSRCLSLFIAGLLVWERVACQCECLRWFKPNEQLFGKAFQLHFSTCLVVFLDHREGWCETVLNPLPGASFPPSPTIKEILITWLKPGCSTNQDLNQLTE